MARQPTKSTAVATQQQNEPRAIDRFKQQLELAAPTIMHMVPAHIPFPKFKAMVVTAVAYNPKLLECTSTSLLRAAAEAAELGLSLNPSLKEADILPVWNKKAGPDGQGANEAQMRPRFMGLMKLARQSGDIVKISSQVVYERDHFVHTEGMSPTLEHQPYVGKSRRQIARDLWASLKREPQKDEIDAEAAKHDPGLKTHAYCVWWLKDGTQQFEVMTADDIDAIRTRSPAGSAGPWVTDEDEMWRKTVIRRASKYMPMSSETFKQAVHLDNLREVGDDDPFFGQQYKDVTDVPVAETAKPAPSAAARTQTQSLEDKLAGPASARIAPPLELDGPDWLAWKAAMIDASSKMPTEKLEQFARLHEDLIADAPDEVAASIRKAYGVK